MKKFLILLFLAIVFAFSAHARQWVSFSKSDPSTPELNLLISNSQTVSFEVTIPEFQIIGDTIINTNAGRDISQPPGPVMAPYGEGIYLSSAGQGNVDNRVISGNEISQCETGLYIYNSKAKICGNQIFNNHFGVRLFNNSQTSFTGFNGVIGESRCGYQIIRDNSSYEIYASQNAFPSPFIYNQIIDENNGGNPNNDPLLYYDIPTRGIDPGTGQLCLGIPYNYWGVNFVHDEDIYPPAYFCTSPIWIPPGKANSSLEEELFEAALEHFILGNYASAQTAFLNLIETYPQSEFAIASLHELFALEQFVDNDYATLHDYYASFTPADSTLFDVADFLATRCNVWTQNWQPAVDWYEYRIENPPSYQDSVFAVIDLGDIHLMMAADTTDTPTGTKARPICYYRLADIKPRSKQEYETNKSNLLATLPQIKKPHTTNPIPQTDKKGSLGLCIPNPTTGSATITFDIYTEGAVELKIYNTLGQLMQALPQGGLKKGIYRTKISLAGTPAGIYHYVLFVNGERVDAKKLIVN
ncbi:MAG: T9SS type A sorting domain-containing protein [Lentimicrobiaceae bacterium]|nr:T9SS type A sorting domain-containing protein [Lentimicrobiaceae bacterium]